jgi:hypothetical protein
MPARTARGRTPACRLPVREERDQDDERKRYAKQQQQNRPHEDSVVRDARVRDALEMRASDVLDVIPLPPADRRGEAGAKRSRQ